MTKQGRQRLDELRKRLQEQQGKYSDRDSLVALRHSPDLGKELQRREQEQKKRAKLKKKEDAKLREVLKKYLKDGILSTKEHDNG